MWGENLTGSFGEPIIYHDIFDIFDIKTLLHLLFLCDCRFGHHGYILTTRNKDFLSQISTGICMVRGPY
jgi:hypothetical protein